MEESGGRTLSNNLYPNVPLADYVSLLSLDRPSKVLGRDVCVFVDWDVSESISENEEYPAKSIIFEPQQAQCFGICFTEWHAILHGSLMQPHRTARGQQKHSKQALQRHPVVLSRNL